MSFGSRDGPSTITALLGPTNTGKTHRAIQELLSHDTGMMGLPLRLLAREVYDRVSAVAGAGAVALVTGEEKVVPPRPRFWICTVEAMPLDLDVDFLAVDEIQLAATAERGHVFTDRLLHARGRRATWFMGAATMRPIITELVPTAEHRSQPRLSSLAGAGAATLGTLPPRSAVVAFSMTHVYELAERLRRKRGGAAVVLGALSPRARNAQVELYQSGEVEFMVATDAIGMGLNMDVGHVAFAELSKFDGQEVRVLEPAELAQIAGRAGRHLADGTFGTLAPRGALPERVTRAIEQHEFPDVRRLMWRSRDLELTSVGALLQSLRAPAPARVLRRTERAEDETALVQLSEMPEVRARAHGPQAVALLWEVCQVPDFRKLLVDHHARLLADIFLELTGPRGRLTSEWLREPIERLDDTGGTLDDLLTRLAFIRTWTYVTHRADWLESPEQWQRETRAIEDRLSDALHERLVQRFVDGGRPGRGGGRRAGPARGPGRAREVAAGPKRPDSPFAVLATLAARLAPGPTVAPEVDDAISVERLSLADDGTLRSGERVVGRLVHGASLLEPDVVVERSSRARDERHRPVLLEWLRAHLSARFAPLALDPEDELSPAARGLFYQLARSLGTVRTQSAKAQLFELTAQDRSVLRRRHVVVGDELIFARALLEPKVVALRATLTRVASGTRLAAAPAWPDGTLASVPAHRAVSDAAYLAMGYPRGGPCAVRADHYEDLHRTLARLARRRAPLDDGRLSRRLGCTPQAARETCHALGYALAEDGVPRRFRPSGGRRKARSP